MSEFIFTFGFIHTDPATGASRSKTFTRIEARDWEAARQKMNATFGRQWAFQYESEDAAGVAKWGLREVTESLVPYELAVILGQAYKDEGVRVWWGGENGLLDGERAVDVWRRDPARVLQVAEQLLGQVAT